jgi:predicted RNA-binding Zn-ribbon protein involved in translation (DUF1610 family)
MKRREYKYKGLERLLADLLSIIDGDLFASYSGIERSKDFTIRMNHLDMGYFLKEIKDVDSIKGLNNGDRTPKKFKTTSGININMEYSDHLCPTHGELLDRCDECRLEILCNELREKDYSELVLMLKVEELTSYDFMHIITKRLKK